MNFEIEKSLLNWMTAELVTNQALFPGDSELQQLLHIFRLLGTPNEEIWPGVSKLVNWHEYPQWSPKPMSSAVPGLDQDGLNLLTVSLSSSTTNWSTTHTVIVSYENVWNCRRCCNMNHQRGFQPRKLWSILILMILTSPVSEFTLICLLPSSILHSWPCNWHLLILFQELVSPSFTLCV